jgi:hypothetical protein
MVICLRSTCVSHAVEYSRILHQSSHVVLQQSSTSFHTWYTESYGQRYFLRDPNRRKYAVKRHSADFHKPHLYRMEIYPGPATPPVCLVVYGRIDLLTISGIRTLTFVIHTKNNTPVLKFSDLSSNSGIFSSSRILIGTLAPPPPPYRFRSSDSTRFRQVRHLGSRFNILHS